MGCDVDIMGNSGYIWIQMVLPMIVPVISYGLGFKTHWFRLLLDVFIGEFCFDMVWWLRGVGSERDSLWPVSSSSSSTAPKERLSLAF